MHKTSEQQTLHFIHEHRKGLFSDCVKNYMQYSGGSGASNPKSYSIFRLGTGKFIFVVTHIAKLPRYYNVCHGWLSFLIRTVLLFLLVTSINKPRHTWTLRRVVGQTCLHSYRMLRFSPLCLHLDIMYIFHDFQVANTSLNHSVLSKGTLSEHLDAILWIQAEQATRVALSLS